MNVSPAASHALPGYQQQSGWQLAQRAWQDSGVNWETGPDDRTAEPAPYTVEDDPYAARAYTSAPHPYTRRPYGERPSGERQYAERPYEAGQYEAGTYETGLYEAATYEAALYETGFNNAGPRRDGNYDAGRRDDGAYGAGLRDDGAHGAGQSKTGAYEMDPRDDSPQGTGRRDDGAPRAGLSDDSIYEAGPRDDGAYDAGSCQDDAYEGGPSEDDPYEAGPSEDDNYDADLPEADLNGAASYAAGRSGDEPYDDEPYEDDGDDDDAYDGDAYGAGPALAAEHAPNRQLTDPHPTRPDRHAIADPADASTGVGPWPVQPFPTTPEPALAAEPAMTAPTFTRRPESVASPAFGPRPESGASPAFGLRPESVAPAAFTPFSESGAPAGFTASPVSAPPLAFAASRSSQATRAFAAPPLSAPVAPPAPYTPPAPFASPTAVAPPAPGAHRGESDELFRAWQGSVREASGGGGSRTARRPAGALAHRGRGWQAVKIGVPAVVIVTVGAGALLMLTGRANEMLAERASVGPIPSATPAFSASLSPVPATLAGYPGGHGTVGVAGMWSADGLTVAVGYADNHPAVWRRAPDGNWTLVSTSVLGGLPGHLTSVAEGPLGWVAVGSVTQNGTVEPMVYQSADGVTWSPLPGLTALAGTDAQFLGVAAGPGGYLVVGRQGSGSSTSAGLWWSGDLRGWSNGGNSGNTGSLTTAAVSVGNGFVAVGSEMNCHTIWTSPDGKVWTSHDLAKPDGAQTAILRSVAAGPGGHIVAAGFATKDGSDLPIVVASTDGGVHQTQVVLSAPAGPAAVTAVTAAGDGFVAVGLAGPASAQHAVTWTSADGLTWSAAKPLGAAGRSEVTALTDTSAATAAPATTANSGTAGSDTGTSGTGTSGTGTSGTGSSSTGSTVTGTAQHDGSPTLLTIPGP